jgi:hypothetical protein
MAARPKPYAGFSPTSTAAIEAVRVVRTKSAEPSDDLAIRRTLAPFGSIVGSMILGGLVNQYFGDRMMSALDKTPKAKKQQLKKILRHANLSKMPAIPYPRLNNAFYADPEYWGDPYHIERQLPPIEAYFKKHRDALNRARQYGLVAYDPNFGTQGILAHEAGHATIRNQPANSLSRFNQSYLRPIGNSFNAALGVPSGIIAGILTGNPLVGAGVGGLVGGVTAAPTLINESQATRHAYRYADKNIKDPNENTQTRKALNNAWGTYASGLLAPAIIGGGLAGGIAYNPDSWQHLKNMMSGR